MASLSGLRRQRGSLPRLWPFVPLLLRSLVRRPTPPRAPVVAAERARLPAAPRARAAGDLTVFSVIRNGIENGYPFVEAYGSWLRYCDRLLVVDGESTDGTDAALAVLGELDERIEVVSRPWPAESEGGSAIARLTESARVLAAEGATRLVYVQADEIYTAGQRALLQGWTNGAVEFAGCVNFWNSFDRVLENEFPMRYVRLFPAAAEVRALGDGYSFDVGEAQVETVPEQYLHYGWCFPVNVLHKHVSHSRIYRDSLPYRLRGRLARLMLSQGVYDRELLDAFAPHYRAVPFTGAHPDCVRHLIGLEAYDPSPGLELLRSGAVW